MGMQVVYPCWVEMIGQTIGMKVEYGMQCSTSWDRSYIPDCFLGDYPWPGCGLH